MDVKQKRVLVTGGSSGIGSAISEAMAARGARVVIVGRGKDRLAEAAKKLSTASNKRLNDTAVTLFTDEFKLHLPGGPYDFPVPAVMAFLSGCGEITFPVFLVLGLGTRFAAKGLLFMTFIVELTVPDGWPVHLTWAAMALAIMAWGPGRLSADQAIDLVASTCPYDRQAGLNYTLPALCGAQQTGFSAV